jgi:microcystin-dependent protein
MVRTLNFSPLGSDAPTRLVLSADAQPPEQQRDWALGTIAEVAAIEADIEDPRWNIAANQQGESPEWIFTPTETIAFGPGEKITLTLDNVVSSLPEGSATLYLRYEHVNGSGDGQFDLPVVKSSEAIRDLPLSGGGTVTWGGADGRLRWSKPFLVYGRSNPTVFGDGYVEIPMPIVGDIPAEHVHDNQPRSVNQEGILLRDWEALYAVHDQGRGASALSFRIIDHTKPFRTAGNWRLLAAVNPPRVHPDQIQPPDRTITLGSGVTLSFGGASSAGSPIPVGTIIMWSGSLDRIPAGWALCDGQNGAPDLRDRFIVGSGAGYGVGVTGGANTITLMPNEMPVHAHSGRIGAAGAHQHTLHRGGGPVMQYTWAARSGVRSIAAGDDENQGASIGTNWTGDHAHSLEIDVVGGGQPHENRPPYFALAFLMKL